MSELQSHEYVIPAFLLLPQPRTEASGTHNSIEDFLKYVQGWSEILPPEELE